jgi:hypothetical protein
MTALPRLAALLAISDEPQADSSWKYMLVFVGVSIIVMVLWRAKRKQQKQKDAAAAETAPLHAPEAFALRRTQDTMRSSVDGMISELTEACRGTGAHLETRIRVLNELIAEADRRIAELRALSSRRQSAAPSIEAAGPVASAVRVASAVEDRPRAAPPAPTPAAQGQADRFARVYDLADRGMDAVAISRETGYHRGEVELMLSLRAVRAASEKR